MKSAKQSKSKAPARRVTNLIVRRGANAAAPHIGRLHIGPVAVRAALGKAGVSYRKREGDGMSPAGSYWLKQGYFRADRQGRIASGLSLRPLSNSLGWCDDPASRRYNKPVVVGAAVHHERLWRDDGVYDILLPTSHNACPTVIGVGSAIFFHLAKPGYPGTEGCVAISPADMRRLLPRLAAKVRLTIER